MNKPTKAQKKRLNKAIKKSLDHEAIKYANSQIAFNALRQGTKGYTGEPIEPHMEKIFGKLIANELARQREEIVEELEKHDCPRKQRWCGCIDQAIKTINGNV